MKKIFPLSQVVMTNVFRLVGLFGSLTAIAGMVFGLWSINKVEVVLDDTLHLANESLDALQASSTLMNNSLESVSSGLGGLQGATDGMSSAFEQSETVLNEIGTLVSTDIASSVKSLDNTMPGLIQVAETIDGAMQALSNSPLNLPWDDKSFSKNLSQLHKSLKPISKNLVEQGTSIKETAKFLSVAGADVLSLNEQVSELSETIEETAYLLESYDKTLSEGVSNLEESQKEFRSMLWGARIIIIFFSLSYLVLMVVPLQLSAMTRVAIERKVARMAAQRKASPEGVGESYTEETQQPTPSPRVTREHPQTGDFSGRRNPPVA